MSGVWQEKLDEEGKEMNKEYIEREALLETINEPWERIYEKCAHKPVYDLYRMVVKRIKKAPAEDVEPVRHGKWIPIVSYFHGKPDGRYYCSVCHRVENIKGIYCRLCGARMDGGKK